MNHEARRRRAAGQTLLIVLITIFVLSALVTLLMNIMRGKRVVRQNLADHMQLFYLADSGVTWAFHRLKGDTWRKRWYYPGRGTLAQEIGGGRFEVDVIDLPGEKKAKIVSKAYYRNKTHVIKAVAGFSTETEQIPGRPHSRTRITTIWYLDYDL